MSRKELQLLHFWILATGFIADDHTLKIVPGIFCQVTTKKDEKTAARLTVQPPVPTAMPTTCGQCGHLLTFKKYCLQLLAFIEDLGYTICKGV